ncbi:MAG: anaerobic ribonucleoside-triphosphate reductase activating protein [Desulfomonilaceae bacterium]|nr:anaerobic ribonucleoside-triphosphate reductase activating protein [Desulfomonilaceae bacterium]
MRNNFNIKGFISTSLVDWPGKVSSVIFLGGCGFRCPACHNHRLVLHPETVDDYPVADVMKQLKRRDKWIDGVTVTGGEPTMRKDLPDLLRLFRDRGLKVKLDTNGSNPGVVARLIDHGLVDAIFMDVKAPLDARRYAEVAGVAVDPRIIRRSIGILKSSGLEVVFRTTVVPGLVEEPELRSIRESLGRVPRFIVQPFRNVDTLNPAFSRKREFDLERFELMRSSYEVPSRTESASHRFRRAG